MSTMTSYNHIKLYRNGKQDSYETFNRALCPDLDKTPLKFYQFAIMETAGAQYSIKNPRLLKRGQTARTWHILQKFPENPKCDQLQPKFLEIPCRKSKAKPNSWRRCSLFHKIQKKCFSIRNWKFPTFKPEFLVERQSALSHRKTDQNFRGLISFSSWIALVIKIFILS